MKKIILSLLFSSIIHAQFFFFDDEFDPLHYDGKTIALYDGDAELTSSVWGDKTNNNYDVTLFNTPTIVSNAINGHQAIRFNGTDEYGQRTGTPAANQPYTIYIVFKQLSFINGRYIMDAANNNNLKAIIQFTTSGNILFTSGGVNSIESNPDIPIGTYNLLTVVGNGASSEIRTNDNPAVVGNANTVGSTGITLARSALGTTTYCNVEIAYIIIRINADNTATQNLFINYLKRRFGL